MDKLKEYLIEDDLESFSKVLNSITFDDTQEYPGFIIDVVVNGTIPFLKKVIESKKINLIYNNGLAVIITTENNNLEMTKLLIDTRLFDIQMEDNILLKNAIDNENKDMAVYLLNHDLIPHYSDMELAVIIGTLDIAKLIVEFGVFIDTNLVSLAIDYDHYEMVKYLMSFDQIDPTENDYILFRQALESGNNKIINIIKNDKRNNPNKINEILDEEKRYQV